MRLFSAVLAGILVFSLTSCATESDKSEDAGTKADIARDYPKAKELYLKALEQAKEHNEGIDSIVHKLTGLPNVSFEEKEDLLNQSLKQGEKCGALSKEVESRLVSLAALYELNNPPRYAEAEVYLKKILANSVKQYGDNDPMFSLSSQKYSDRKLQAPSGAYGRVADVLERQGKYEEAEPLRRKVIAIKSKKIPAPDLSFEKKLLNDNLVKQGKSE